MTNLIRHCFGCGYPVFGPEDVYTIGMLDGDPPDPIKAWTEEGEPLCEACAERYQDVPQGEDESCP